MSFAKLEPEIDQVPFKAMIDETLSEGFKEYLKFALLTAKKKPASVNKLIVQEAIRRCLAEKEFKEWLARQAKAISPAPLPEPAPQEASGPVRVERKEKKAEVA